MARIVLPSRSAGEESPHTDHRYRLGVGNRFGRLVAVAGMMLAGILASVPPANAAPSVTGLCGSGYRILEQHDFGGGTVYLTYDGGTNCVVTINGNYGVATPMFAGISIYGVDSRNDTGVYQYYAGPVRLYAANQCIRWGGGANGSYWNSDGDTHCG